MVEIIGDKVGDIVNTDRAIMSPSPRNFYPTDRPCLSSSNHFASEKKSLCKYEGKVRGRHMAT